MPCVAFCVYVLRELSRTDQAVMSDNVLSRLARRSSLFRFLIRWIAFAGLGTISGAIALLFQWAVLGVFLFIEEGAPRTGGLGTFLISGPAYSAQLFGFIVWFLASLVFRAREYRSERRIIATLVLALGLFPMLLSIFAARILPHLPPACGGFALDPIRWRIGDKGEEHAGLLVTADATHAIFAPYGSPDEFWQAYNVRSSVVTRVRWEIVERLDNNTSREINPNSHRLISTRMIPSPSPTPVSSTSENCSKLVRKPKNKTAGKSQ